jgi:hypothetical protein
MKKYLLLCLAVLFLITACSSADASPSTPTPEYGVPRPTIDYQVVGGTNNSYMVVVDPQDNTDRAGLQAIGDYLCSQHIKCMIWFWDDINQADTTYPVDPDKEQAVIAAYTFDLYQGESKLVVYTLGDQ